MSDKLWVLNRTEYAGQCTGFWSETILLGVFLNKPDMQTVAPFLGRALGDDMGQAISVVTQLLSKGDIELSGFDYSLHQIPIGVLLEQDQ